MRIIAIILVIIDWNIVIETQNILSVLSFYFIFFIDLLSNNTNLEISKKQLNLYMDLAVSLVLNLAFY